MENSLLKSVILQNSDMEDNHVITGLMIRKGVKVKEYYWIEYIAA